MAERGIRSHRLEWSQLRVGVLLIVAVALLAYGVYRVGDLFNVFADRYPLVTLIGRADGLLEGAPVTLAGQRVGQVERIEFLPVGYDRENLSVRLSIDEDVREQIRADSYARVRTQGLLGDKYVDIAPGSPGAPVLADMDTLPGIDPIDLEGLLATADSTLVQARETVGNLRRVTAAMLSGKGTFGRLLTDATLYVQMVDAAAQLEGLLVELRDPSGTIGRLVHDPALYESLTRATARLDSLAGIALYGEGTLARLLHDDTLYEQALAVLQRADTTISAAGGALAGLADGNGTFQRLLRDPALYDQLLKAVVDLQALIGMIRLDPSRLRPVINVDIF